MILRFEVDMEFPEGDSEGEFIAEEKVLWLARVIAEFTQHNFMVSSGGWYVAVPDGWEPDPDYPVGGGDG